jgi:hypothetical protein
MDKCAFCPSLATLTREHVWSDWINEILPDREYSYRRVDPNTSETKTWHSLKLNQTSRVVCGQCNSGWMSDIENVLAKPILRHLIVDTSPRELGIKTLISLAIFAFKTAVVADHVSPVDGPFFSTDQRYTFAKTLDVPDGVYMWFSALKNQRNGAFRSRHSKTQNRTGNDFHIYSFTYIVGHFVLQVAAVKWKGSDLGRPFPVVVQDPSNSAFSIPFWPIDNDTALFWPPSAYLDEDCIDAFTDRWGSLIF